MPFYLLDATSRTTEGVMLKWDKDSPDTFHHDGHTVYDFDRRFALEDEGFIVPGEVFRWKMLDESLNMRLF